MERLNNLYYAQYANELETEPGYDSDHKETYDPLLQSPESEDLYCGDSQYMHDRNEEESLHKDWLDLVKRSDLEDKFRGLMEKGMKMRLRNDRVKFIYIRKGNEVFGAASFKFKITLVYRSLSRKWYISPGYSFVPEVINLKGKLRFGTYDPLSAKVLNIVSDVKRSIDAYMTRLITVHQFMHDVQKRYKDMQFFVKPTLTKMKLIFTENAWPNDLQKLNIKDIIDVELILNKNIQVRNVTYEYIYQKVLAPKDLKEYLNKLEFKLQYFYYYPLEEAFERFMKAEMSAEEESSD